MLVIETLATIQDQKISMKQSGRIIGCLVLFVALKGNRKENHLLLLLQATLPNGRNRATRLQTRAQRRVWFGHPLSQLLC